MSLKSQVSCLFLIILFPLVIYFNSLKSSFQYDDVKLIDRIWISDLEHFKEQVDLRAVKNRPILLLTFAFNNTFHHNRVFGFHLVNLLLHILVTVLIYIIIRLSQRLLYLDSAQPERPGLKRTSDNDRAPHLSFALPFVVALMFSLHPVTTDSVSYISSRSTLLASFFYLLALYIFLRIFSIGSSRHRRSFQIVLAISLLLMHYLAVASKLTAATLPVLLGIWFLFIISPRRFPRLHSILLSKTMLFVYGLLLLIPLGMAFDYKVLDKGLEMYGRIPYFLVQFKVIVFYYLKTFLFPINLNVDVGFPFSTFWNDFKIPQAMIVVFGILVFVFMKGSLLLKAATAWFVLTLAPTSSFVPLNDLAVEHRMYLPMSLGLCLILGLWVARMAKPHRLKFLVFLFIVMGVLTTARNGVWFNEFTLWQDSLKKNPHSPRPYNNLGKAYYERDERDRAMEYFLKGIKISPTFAEPHYNLANVYMDVERLDDAEREYQTAIELEPMHYAAHLGLGSIYNQTARYSKAIEHYKLAIHKRKNSVALDEDYPIARLNLGEVYGKLGRFEEAIRESKRAIELSPSMYKAHFNLGTAYMKLGDLENAERAYLAGLKTNSQFEKALFNLAHLYQLKREWENSNKWFEKFLEIQGPHAKAYFGTAWNYQQLGQWDMTREFYEKSLAANPNYLNARLNLASVHIQLKQFDQAINQFEKTLQQHPEQLQVYVQLGSLYWKTKNDKKTAMSYFNKALRLSPNPREKGKISELILLLSQP